MQRRLAAAPGHLALAAQVRTSAGKLQAIDDHPRAIGGQNALQPERLDRQRADAALWQIDHPGRGRAIELNRRWLPLQGDGALGVAAERQADARKRQIRCEVHEFGWQQILEGQVNVHRVLARLVAC